MYKKVFLVSLFLLLTSIGFTQSDKIKIKSKNLKEVNYIKADDFYLTHYLYIDLFLRENLFPEASHDDVSSFIKAIKKYVSIESPLGIEIEKSGDRNYLITIGIIKKEDGTEILVAYTNWNARERIFEEEIKIENDSYTRWYFLDKNKMTYRKDMSNQNDYSSMDKSDLANAYLFDEILENDAQIEKTIDEALEGNDLSASENIMANLILLKYYIFKRESEKVIKQSKYLDGLFESNRLEPSLKGLEMAFNANKFQIELMKLEL